MAEQTSDSVAHKIHPMGLKSLEAARREESKWHRVLLKQ